MNVIIRNIKKEDIKYVASINVRGWQSAYRGIIDDSFLNSLDVDSVAKRMLTNYKDSSFLVAELDKKVVGFIRYIDNNSLSLDIADAESQVTAFYVDTLLKNKGIGTKLFSYVVSDLKSKGKTNMINWCLKDNEPSKKFYMKMGGIEIGEHIINIGGKDYSEVCFFYDLKNI